MLVVSVMEVNNQFEFIWEEILFYNFELIRKIEIIVFIEMIVFIKMIYEIIGMIIEFIEMIMFIKNCDFIINILKYIYFYFYQ